MSGRVVVRMKGGLGNQLFQYAAARRLALRNNAELVIDDVTGFERDHVYRRQFMLDRFQIAGRRASPRERLEPFGRVRRKLLSTRSKRRDFERRKYIEQNGLEWEPRLLQLDIHDWVYLDGYWQSERYFQDVQDAIRRELQLARPLDDSNVRLLEEIDRTNAVAVHLRWFQPADSSAPGGRDADYYQRALAFIEERVAAPEFFVFSDDIEAARRVPGLPHERTTFVTQNTGDEAAYADLWLMSRCRHLIIANSTFSWWAGWLSPHAGKIVVAPARRVEGEGQWGFEGLIPESWVTL